MSHSRYIRALDEDRDFIAKLKAGDGEAFNVLVSAYAEMIYNVNLLVVKVSQLAEDLTQDVFIRIYRALPGFEGRSALSTWIYRITRNVALAEMEKARYGREASDPAGKVLERAPAETGESGEDEILRAIDREEAIERVRGLLRELKPEQRWAMTLYYTAGRSYREIADIMDVPMGTVKTLLFRAKAELRKMLITEVKDGLS